MYETKESAPVPPLGNCSAVHIVWFIYFYVKAQHKWISTKLKSPPLKKESWKCLSDVSFSINTSTSIKSTEAKQSSHHKLQRNTKSLFILAMSNKAALSVIFYRISP